ncbi:Ribonuclease P protein subunit p29 [Zea mays]|uniref:Ribonuclease P protein subunit p29 n=1 Tax=Zea mays TaxID=4577 RepID=A0A3L6EJ85_MAIZE|nr:Ribonuclease P protein subunit p29 [Zea mays]
MSAISDQKKRTLEALQQQYTAAKAKKLQDEQVKSQKKSNFNTPKPKFDAPRGSKDVAFSSFNCQQKPSTSSGEEINPVYAELSCAFRDTLSKGVVSVNIPFIWDLDGTEVVHNVIYDIIQKGGDAGKITKGAKKYDLYKLMHEMWKDYIKELMDMSPKKKFTENLLSADLHGALLIVAERKAASCKSVNGIMIRDTAETFGIISEDNRFRGMYPSLFGAVL